MVAYYPPCGGRCVPKPEILPSRKELERQRLHEELRKIMSKETEHEQEEEPDMEPWYEGWSDPHTVPHDCGYDCPCGAADRLLREEPEPLEDDELPPCDGGAECECDTYGNWQGEGEWEPTDLTTTETHGKNMGTHIDQEPKEEPDHENE